MGELKNGILTITNIPSINNICLVLLHLSVFSFTSLAAVDLNYRWHYCSSVTANPIFIANRDKLVSSLSNAGAGHDGFYNTTAGQNPDIVYGLFLCRGDLIPETCRNCIDVVTVEIVQRCPYDDGAIIWYDECMLHYSKDSIFSSMELDPYYQFYDEDVDVGVPSGFNQLWETLTNDIATQASKASLGAKKFATKEANYTKSHTIYSLAQCTPDISGEDCYSCLEKAIMFFQFCCKKYPSLTYFPSCILRYDITPFYQQSNRTAEASSPAPLLLPLTPAGKREMSSKKVIKIVVPAISFLVLSSFGCVLGWKARNNKIIARKKRNDGNKAMALQSDHLHFDLSMIETATNNFAEVNKIGAGGFGSVYKGILPNGQQIAVKRLSRSSRQGAQEFQNEVSLVAKLQHRNLVKLLGYCLERKERMLIYEFVPNKSLDCFIFDPEKQKQIDWPKRYKIIKGITRGLLYLHSGSRLKIIHRDLKAGNILLDEDMTPKISDFGIAKILGENKSQECTRRMAGTLGYMPPEYAMHGRFSEKYDVFGFGILMLEIVSGKRNTSFCQSEYADNLLTYAWRHWKDGTSLELMDSTLKDSYVGNEVIRCIHIGLLCVQEDPDARPTMARVDLMLSSSSVSLPSPQRTAFLFGSITETPNLSILKQKSDQSTTITTATTMASSATVNKASNDY